MNGSRKLVGVLAVLLLFPTLAKPSAPLAVPPSRYNLFVVMVNTLNRNHLSLYDYPKRTMPHLERLAGDAYVFTDLVSPTSFTFPVLQSFFKAAPYGRDFYLADPWRREDKYEYLGDYPLSKFIAAQGYSYFPMDLPDNADRPFFSILHTTDLHYPYDPQFRLESRLTARSRRIYRRLLKENTIRLVDKNFWRSALPYDLPFVALGIRATGIPISGTKMWDGLLSNLKETGSSPAAILAAGLPPRLIRRLEKVRSAEDLTPRDKRAIVRALDDFVRRPGSPIGKILFAPGTVYEFNASQSERFGDFVPPSLRIGNITFHNWDTLLVPNIKTQLEGPEPLLSVRDGRLSLAEPLDQRRRLLLRVIYREALEAFLPPLTHLHPQAYSFVDAFNSQAEWSKLPGYEDELALLNELYDARMADLDEKLGGWLDHLGRLGVLEKTIVVFMGDHGEGLMEHGYFEHTKCYDEMINPPLIVRVPGRLKEKTVVKTQLRTCDVLPTLVELMGLAPPTHASPGGTSLASFLAGGPEPDITVISRGDKATPLSLRRNDGWKLIVDRESGRKELYNRKTDPSEKHNVAVEFPAVTAELEEALNRFLYGD